MASAADAGPKAGTKADRTRAKAAKADPTRRLAFRLTLLFALVLLSLGVAGIHGVDLLRAAIAIPPSGAAPSGSGEKPGGQSIGDQVCAAYVTQKYDQLVSLIDPAPVRTAPTPFDAAARSAFVTNLQALDDSAGKVTTCTATGPTPGSGVTDGKTIYTLVMIRGTDPKKSKFTHTIIVVEQSDGSFKIARDSDFHGVPVPA